MGDDQRTEESAGRGKRSQVLGPLPGTETWTLSSAFCPVASHSPSVFLALHTPVLCYPLLGLDSVSSPRFPAAFAFRPDLFSSGLETGLTHVHTHTHTYTQLYK